MKYRITIDGKLLHGLYDAVCDEHFGYTFTRNGVETHKLKSCNQFRVMPDGIELNVWDNDGTNHVVFMECAE